MKFYKKNRDKNPFLKIKKLIKISDFWPIVVILAIAISLKLFADLFPVNMDQSLHNNCQKFLKNQSISNESLIKSHYGPISQKSQKKT